MAIAFWAFAVFLVLIVGISACFYHDADAAHTVAGISGTFAILGLVLLAFDSWSSHFDLTVWSYAVCVLYYLITTAIIHARLGYLCRNLNVP